jgi:hypothetical protein
MRAVSIIVLALVVGCGGPPFEASTSTPDVEQRNDAADTLDPGTLPEASVDAQPVEGAAADADGGVAHDAAPLDASADATPDALSYYDAGPLCSWTGYADGGAPSYGCWPSQQNLGPGNYECYPGGVPSYATNCMSLGTGCRGMCQEFACATAPYTSSVCSFVSPGVMACDVSTPGLWTYSADVSCKGGWTGTTLTLAGYAVNAWCCASAGCCP